MTQSINLKVKRLSNEAKLPTYGSDGAACFDIYPTVEVMIAPGKTEMLSTGLAFEVPEGYVLMVYGRSSSAKNNVRLANCVGVVDSDYRGELKVMLRNECSHSWRFVSESLACAQAMVIPVPEVTFTLTDELSVTSRGTGGFGSTDQQ